MEFLICNADDQAHVEFVYTIHVIYIINNSYIYLYMNLYQQLKFYKRQFTNTF